ncbi:MAG: YggS family pyridoxal phosphate-dependent enzyme [archaeon]
MNVEGNITDIRKRIDAALERADRHNEVRIVAVAKGVEIPIIKKAIAAGINSIGENRVQEAEEKKNMIEEDVSWHMIGHLQSNKARLAASIFDWVHSVDTLKLASRLNTMCADLDKKLNILIQVNISGEKTKAGAREETLKPLIEHINKLPHLKLMGLMTMAPHYENPEETRPVFRELLRLKNLYSLPYISMGMTNDFEVAVEEGANIVRIGRAIFGEKKEAK